MTLIEGKAAKTVVTEWQRTLTLRCDGCDETCDLTQNHNVANHWFVLKQEGTNAPWYDFEVPKFGVKHFHDFACLAAWVGRQPTQDSGIWPYRDPEGKA